MAFIPACVVVGRHVYGVVFYCRPVPNRTSSVDYAGMNALVSVSASVYRRVRKRVESIYPPPERAVPQRESHVERIP